MSNPKIDELLAWMNGKSITYGWDVLVAYDKFEANRLLTQLYMERYDQATHELPPVNGIVDLNDTKEILNGLKFSAPRLSFENANLESSQATLTLDFIGGEIISLSDGSGAPRHINGLRKILPLNSPQLTMQIPLEGPIGSVGDDGNVTLCLDDGTDFRANFVMGDTPAEQVGLWFKNFFKCEVSDEQKKFPLGNLGGDNDHLKPRSFAIKTMPAPGAKVKGAANYSDGAILLFVEVEGGSSGGYPGKGSGFMYPLPIDSNGEQYTGAVVVGSLTLMEKLIKPDVEVDIGRGVELAASTSTNDAATLTATSGSLLLPDLMVYRDFGNDENVRLVADYDFHFAHAQGPMTFAAGGRAISLNWKTAFSTSYWYKEVKADWWDEEKEGALQCTSQAEMKIEPLLNDTGVVSFEQRSRNFGFTVKADQELKGFTHDDLQGNDVLTKFIKDQVDVNFATFFQSISVPDVDTFLVRNLLFPGYNALVPAKVMLPGDLYLPGHLDPSRTAFDVTPSAQVIEAGAEKQFGTSEPITDVTWSVRGSGDDTDIGTIDAKGLYKAPPSSVLPEGHKIVIVTAEGTKGGKQVKASALVTLLTSTINVAPLFQTCDAGKSVTLTAEALHGVVPAWSLKADKGGTLSTSTGNECIYTAGNYGDDGMYIDTVLVKNPTTNSVTEANILVFNSFITEPVFISEDSQPETGKVQLHICDGRTPVTPDFWDGVCTVLYGPGTVSESGLYEAPAGATGYVVIYVKVPLRSGYTHGVMILPLPMDNARNYTMPAVCLNKRIDRGPRKVPKTT